VVQNVEWLNQETKILGVACLAHLIYRRFGLSEMLSIPQQVCAPLVLLDKIENEARIWTTVRAKKLSETISGE
jgi:hypothetical protein